MLLMQVAHSFLIALQNDERANYQLDVKFQELYLKKVVAILQCHLSEGAVPETNGECTELKCDDNNMIEDEVEEGELPNSHGESFVKSVS